MTTSDRFTGGETADGTPTKNSALVAVVLAAAAVLGLSIVSSPSFAYVLIVSLTVGLPAIGLLLVRPVAFLGSAMALYGLMQVLLLETEVISVGTIEINASKLFVTTVTGLLSLRILVELARPKRLPGHSSAVITSLLFTAWALVALLRSPYPGESVAVAARLVACTVAMIYAFVFVTDLRGMRYLWYGSATTTIVAGGLSLLEVLRGRGQQEALMIGAFRAEGSFGGAVATGTVCFFGMAFAVLLLSSLEKIGKLDRVLAITALLAGAVGIVTTFTRTSIVGTGVFVTAFLLFRSGEARRTSTIKRLLVSASVVGALALAFTFVSGETVRARIADLPGRGGQSSIEVESGSGRGLIWAGLIHLQMQSSPGEWMIGHGLLAVQPALERRIGLRIDGHNSTLDVLYDLGLVGLVLYYLIAWQILDALRKGARELPKLGPLLQGWRAYVLAYYLSTEMFNGFVYMVGVRWYTFILIGALLSLASAPNSLGPSSGEGDQSAARSWGG